MLIQQKAWNVFEDLKAKRTSVTDEALALTVQGLIIWELQGMKGMQIL